MTKKDIVDVVSERTGCTKKAAKEIVDVAFDSVVDFLMDGEDVRLSGFGTFTTSVREARRGRNPQTGEEMIIDAHKTIRFKPAKAFKMAVR